MDLDDVRSMVEGVPPADPVGVELHVDHEYVRCRLFDGRWIAVPLSWYPKLQAARPEQRLSFLWREDGHVVQWPELGLTIPIASMIKGPSQQASEVLEKAKRTLWREERPTRILYRKGHPVILRQRSMVTVLSPSEARRVRLAALRHKMVATVRRWLQLR